MSESGNENHKMVFIISQLIPCNTIYDENLPWTVTYG